MSYIIHTKGCGPIHCDAVRIERFDVEWVRIDCYRIDDDGHQHPFTHIQTSRDWAIGFVRPAVAV